MSDNQKQQAAPEPARPQTRGIGVIASQGPGTSSSIADEILRLEAIGIEGLQSRWRAALGSKAPEHLSRTILIGILAHRMQAEAIGELDNDTAKLLDRIGANHRSACKDGNSSSLSSHVPSLCELGLPDRRTGRLQPGTVLVREHADVSHHVMVMTDGFSWNGETYSSMSKVALAITGTSWNGPRFFGIGTKRQKKVNKPETPAPRSRPVSDGQCPDSSDGKVAAEHDLAELLVADSQLVRRERSHAAASAREADGENRSGVAGISTAETEAGSANLYLSGGPV